MSRTFTKENPFRRVQRRLKRIFRVGMFVLLAAMLIFFLLSAPPVQRGIFYPFRYRDTVEFYSDKYHVDKYLAIAVMKNESNFVSSAISHSGAVGLMQIMPETADWIASQLDDNSLGDEHFTFNVKKLYDPETNIRYGIWYLSTLEEEFEGNDVLALAAYNAGRGNVLHWMEKYGWKDDFNDVEAIPYRETRDYVRRVLNCRRKYRLFYN